MDYLSNIFSLKGNVALVTGGSYGIGFAIAKALARAGAVIAFYTSASDRQVQSLQLPHSGTPGPSYEGLRKRRHQSARLYLRCHR